MDPRAQNISSRGRVWFNLSFKLLISVTNEMPDEQMTATCPECRVSWPVAVFIDEGVIRVAVTVPEEEIDHGVDPRGCACDLTDDQMTAAYASVAVAHPGLLLPWQAWS